jgi:hypothetical protein
VGSPKNVFDNLDDPIEDIQKFDAGQRVTEAPDKGIKVPKKKGTGTLVHVHYGHPMQFLTEVSAYRSGPFLIF